MESIIPGEVMNVPRAVALWRGGWDTIPAPVKTEEFMAAFYICADDSGKLGNPNDLYAGLCGYVGHVSEWGRFMQEWENARLRWQVPPMHMSAVMYPDRDKEWKKVIDGWGKFWKKKRSMMLNDFAAVIRSAQIVCVGAMVDAMHFRSLPDSVFKKAVKEDPLFLAFHQVVMRGIEVTEVIDKHSPITLVIDDDRESSLSCYKMLHSLKETFPKVKERVHGLSFVNDRSFPSIQAADMIAYESRRLIARRKNKPKTKVSDLYASLTLLGIHQPLLYTPKILDLLNSKPYDGGKSDDEKKLGI
jgi:hypothetical protein